MSSTQRAPDAIMGKPNTSILELILDQLSADCGQPVKRECVCMVGDRLDTDILFGKRGGLKTLLVMTGVSTSHDLETASADTRPDYVLDSLADLMNI